MSPDLTESILDRWARRDAAKAIAAELGMASRAIYQIVAAARERDDPRATFRNGREKAGRPTQDRKLIMRAGNRRRPYAAMGGVPGWWFGKRTIMVTRLGTGSVDCLQVPVSVSDVLRCPPEAVQNVTVRLSPARSFREALADWPHQGPPEPICGPLLTEQAQPPRRR